MTITLKKPDGPEYVAFSEEVKARARTEFGDFDYGEVNSFVGAFHDAVLLYSLALNETIAQNGSIKDGAAVTSRMWNRTFSGITGNVSIDSNGDKNSDYSLLNYDSDLEQFTAAGHYYGNVKLYQEVRPINWPGGRDSAPPDTPLCGFSGEGCVEEGKLQQWVFVTVIFSVILAIIGLIGVLYYRRYKAELELNSMSWRIRWDEIHDDRQRGGLGRSGAFPSSELEYGEVMLPLLPKLSIIAGMSQTAPRMSLTSKMHRNSAVGYSQRPSLQPGRPGAAVALNEGRRDSKVSYTSRLSIDTYAVMEPGIMGKQLQLFTKTAYYKKSVVALKSMSSPPYTINRAFLLEIKNIKNLQNDHIVRFIGMCVDPGHEYIVTEYCQKGSLQDIVENDQIDLDAMFKHSLIQDITRGMDYLHTSVIRYHGNLKSTNCVVDSRFVLKITDFGLKLCRQSSRKISSSEEEKYQMCRRKLWTAPELLDSQSVPSVQAYQKGDVYSFAVICQEVIYRKGVFYVKDKDFTEPEDILNELREDPSFRPTLRNEDCDVEQEAMLIRKCWSQEPMDRPDFQLVKNAYRRFMKHNGRGTLVENLLTRMEQYANNLESLVEDRTQSYLEQKKKAEDLLYMMLPKSIASDLIKGQSVKAEWFNEVTIYFSDICGFTALSAESTPMQIVAMLNDLYTDFDNAVEEFDVYKVETIGDAYMVVSGLPNRNGHNHAREIARLSLKLLEIVQTFTIRHKPTEKLKLRIGMHTGPVCAGVVGLKMPRYCLFGDTVNTASRMESNGLPLKIHVSPSTKILLDEFETFQLELRGEVEMKGKGTMTTYWLLGENQVENTSAKDLRQQPNSEEKQLASTAHPEKHTYRPYSITEETNLTVPPIASNLRHSDPDIGFIHNSLPLLPPGNSRPSRTPKFRENGVTFQSTSQEAPLLNGHADDTL
ncbi:atrial natriuretic peptide receptor 1-like [Watersipora subatra]|uniref:atrial natriuretic peptide receptor 1-like n=1 Tax=Watersipora subatra TaxID=2589382 RepID=UPI00355C4A12